MKFCCCCCCVDFLREDLCAGGAAAEAAEAAESSVRSPPGRIPSAKITVFGSPFLDPSLRKTPEGGGGRGTAASTERGRGREE